jgi:hypothetical protein
MRTRAQDDADYGDGASLGLTVNVHVRAETTVEVTTYPDQERATVAFEGYRHATDVTLFLHTAELRELRDLLNDTLTTLSAATDPAADPTGADTETTNRAA